MKEILETILQNLVDNPEAINIVEKEENQEVLFEVSVAEGDMGKVIGKQGKVAKSIRTVMKSIAGKTHKKVTIHFVDER